MSKQIARSIIILVVFLSVVRTWEVRSASAQESLLPKKLAIYFAWPSFVNGSEGNIDLATEVFNDYATVVFGDGLQDTLHGDHTNTTTIINNLKTSPNQTAVYGYIPVGNLSPGGLTIAEIKGRVDDWATMGVAGIFLEAAGYDFCVTRQRQNEIVDYVHSKGLSVFINAWNPDDVFSPQVVGEVYGCGTEQMNPDPGAPTHLGLTDIYLLISFQISLNEFQDPAFWVTKSDKAWSYRNQFGTQMATVTTVAWSNPTFDQAKFDYAWWSTLLYGFDYMGWGELWFSAADSNLPFRVRPNPANMGSAFSSSVTHTPPVHTRTTTAGTLEVNTTTHTGKFTSLLPKKLAIYYGYPSLVNGSGGNLGLATEVFNDYDTVVLGDGLQDASHGDHTNTTIIINNLKISPNHTAVYGYIPIGVGNLPPGQMSLTIAEIKGRVDDWSAMGVAGIFLDQAGYDFCVTRQRQNEIVDYVHSKGLSAFINAWNPDDVFSPQVVGSLGCTEQMNPNPGTPTHLGSADVYLHESFQISLNEFQDPTFWATKSDKAWSYRNQFGTQMATVTTVAWSNPTFDQAKFDYAWWSTQLYGFDYMGWGELWFSAADNNLPFHMRPDSGDIGSAFTSSVVHDPPMHTRTTTAGTFEVNTTTYTGKFTPN